MAETPPPVEIGGLMFATTSDGYLLEGEVRRHVDALQRELGELRGRLDHVSSLERLAQATVMKADELAVEIESEARRRVDEATLAAETELVERRRRFEVEAAAEQAAAQARVAQLQAALEGTVQTLGRALQAVGAPALEMPAASVPSWNPPPTPEPAAAAPPETNGQVETPAETVPTGATADDGEGITRFGMPGPPLGYGDGDPDIIAFEAEAAPANSAASEDVAADISAMHDEGGPVAADEIVVVDELDESQWAAASATAAERSTAVATPNAPPPSNTYELAEADRAAPPEPTPIRPAAFDRGADEPSPSGVPDAGPRTLSRSGPMTIEIDMRPVKSFADLARVTKLLGRIAPGAQPVDLNLPQHRALFSVRGNNIQALASQLQAALPDAKVVEREEGLDVLLEGGG